MSNNFIVAQRTFLPTPVSTAVGGRRSYRYANTPRMVTDKITDGKRIAQLLASEITGLETGALEHVSVTDADPDAMPADTGTFAFRIASEETIIAEVFLYPEYVELQFNDPPPESAALQTSNSEASVRQVTSGAEVKAAVDLIATVAKSHHPS